MEHKNKAPLPAAIVEGKTRPLPASAAISPGNGVNIALYFKNQLQSRKIRRESTALLWENRSFTFDWLDKTSDAFAVLFAKNFNELLLPQQNKCKLLIGICIKPSELAIAVLFSILKLGLAYVPFDSSYPKERIYGMVENCGVRIIIADRISLKENLDNLLSFLATSQATVLCLDDIWSAAMMATITEDTSATAYISKTSGPGEGDYELNKHGEDLAVIMHTSGSTSEPKAVCITHRNILNRLTWQWETFPYHSYDICCWKTSLTFVDSVCEIFAPLLQGIPLAIINHTDSRKPEALIRNIYEYKVSRIILVPSLLASILKLLQLILNNNNNNGEKQSAASQLLESVELWICSGETLTMELATEFFHLIPFGAELCNFYGCTEIMADVCCVRLTNPMLNGLIQTKGSSQAIPIGLDVVNNTIIYIGNPVTNLPLAIGEIGEICVTGENVTAGYLKTDGAIVPFESISITANNKERIYYTGDLGYIAKERNVKLLYFMGRKDSQIKIRGQKVNLLEIEAVLLKSLPNLIQQVCILTKTSADSLNPQYSTVIACIIPAQAGSAISKPELTAAIRSKLRPCEYPNAIHILEPNSEFPKLVNGKIDKRSLLQQYLTQSATENTENAVTFADESMKALVTTISEITGTPINEIMENVSLSFYEIGGNSLNSISVVTKLWEKGFPIEIEDFLNASSVVSIYQKLLNKIHIAATDSTAILPDDKSSGLGTRTELLSYQQQLSQNLHIELISEKHRPTVIKLLSEGFVEKGDLELLANPCKQDYVAFIESIWSNIASNKLCFVCIQTNNQEIVGVSLNFDYVDFIQLKPVLSSKEIQYVFEIIEFVEVGIRSKLLRNEIMQQPPSSKFLRSSLAGTCTSLDYRSNVQVMELMSKYTMELAKTNGFIGILSINTSLLTQQIDRDIQKYETLVEYTIKEFIASDGTKPFQNALDQQSIICSIKYLQA